MSGDGSPMGRREVMGGLAIPRARHPVKVCGDAKAGGMDGGGSVLAQPPEHVLGLQEAALCVEALGFLARVQGEGEAVAAG